MLSLLLLLALQSPSLTPAPSARQTVSPPRIEKLTADEQKQLTDANTQVADAKAKADAATSAEDAKKSPETVKAAGAAEMKLLQAQRNLKGTQDGIALNHHANTECGCYVQSQGRDYDRVEFKDDTIVIHHIHEAPPSLQ